MKDQNKVSYTGENAQVHWDGRVCIHYGECGRAAGELFIGGRQPWCQPDHAGDEEIRDVVLRCPTGALTATFADGSGVVPDFEPNRVAVTQNGPLYVSGDLRFEDQGEEMPGTRYRAALCRCGASGNKPYCDNSHIEADFRDSGAVGETGPGTDGEDGSLKVRVIPDGPLLLSGKLKIRASSGRIAWSGEKAALCRCGHSVNKPFCDGSHRAAGFKA
jgi:CDGSH-type Zn-finger protein/uncharacterized Fe-S cluster protein YjdI